MAIFKVRNTFTVTNRGFVLVGEIIEGSISVGDYLSLPEDDITTDIQILGVEMVDIISKRTAYIGLVFSREDEEVLKKFTLEGTELKTLSK